MLVLTRKLDQTITIGNPLSLEDAVEITVIEVRGDQVRLGIVAPRETLVHRKEVWDQVKQEQREQEQREAEGQAPK